MKKYQRDLLDRVRPFLDGLGAHMALVGGGRHLKLWVTLPNGSRCMHPVPGTPSDWRSEHNFVAQVRRMVEARA